jgi:glucose-1-phosphate cytidylyltransferase
MIEIGGRPILWHIMKIYTADGFHDFVVLCGYRGDAITQYFANYFLNTSDVTIDLAANTVETHSTVAKPWRVTLVDTGDETMTAGGSSAQRPTSATETFRVTYGDCVARLDIGKPVDAHCPRRHAGDVDGDPAARPLRGIDAFRGRADRRISRKTRRRRQLGGGWDNDGFFVLERYSTTSRTTAPSGSATRRTARARRTARGVQALGLLAAHGHPAGQEGAGGALGQRCAALEGVGRGPAWLQSPVRAPGLLVPGQSQMPPAIDRPLRAEVGPARLLLRNHGRLGLRPFDCERGVVRADASLGSGGVDEDTW